MSKRRALDFAQLLGAASSVARKNAELHASRFELLKRTTGTQKKDTSKDAYPNVSRTHYPERPANPAASNSEPLKAQAASQVRTNESTEAYKETAYRAPLEHSHAQQHSAAGTWKHEARPAPGQAPFSEGAPSEHTATDRQSEDDAMFSQLLRSPKVLKSLQNERSHLPHNLGDHSQVEAPHDPRQPQHTSRAATSIPAASKSGAGPTTSATGTSHNLRIDESHVPDGKVTNTETAVQYQLRESKVPSSRFGRLWQYGGLATSMAFGAVGESIRRVGGSDSTPASSVMLSNANMERLVSKLSRMRGAALKLGQIISFQDIKLIPGPIQEVLQRVQDSADFMPAWQRDKVLASNLGSDWRDLFTTFEDVPMAAASIGQVHGAVLRETGMPVAVKVQYPGVAESIDSDLNNLSTLLVVSRLLPKGLYLDKTIDNARTELAWECDYKREADAARRFSKLLADDMDTFIVPEIVSQASAAQVLTLERMNGVAVTKISGLSQEQRDWIASNILRLCLRELFEFHFMQTDPNWTNFLYNSTTHKIELLDFGASREYPGRFVDLYTQVLQAAARNDRDAIVDLSVQLRYLTGHESAAMRNAHVDSVLTLAEPFGESAPDCYDFQDQTITDRVRALIPVMLRERLAPPPEETYSLHRKLSGAFLLCARLGARVRAKEMFSHAGERASKAQPHPS